MPRAFAVTFDYRCPFAFNGHAAVVAALRGGADFDVRYAPLSLDQIHVPEGEPPVWDRDPSEWGSGVLALCYGIAARDHFPDQFLDAHMELFAARHERGGKLNEVGVLHDAVARADIDPNAIAEIAGRPETLATLAKEHTEMVEGYEVFGVPTFVEGDEAVFIRFMERGNVDDLHRALDLLQWDRMNEFKRTRIPR
ncbi:MAG: DsbA family protein [Acidimicrobiia bacterium]|jgi:predicted DsbA family dithiol-disulfide isomerase